MKKNIVRSSIAGIVLGAGALMAPSVAISAAPTAGEECAKELLLSYFPEPIVSETLKKFNIPQDKWAGIKKSLANKDKDVIKLVEQKAASMDPNPLKDPQQRQAAVKLFRETLLQVFTDALKENGVEDTAQSQAMLDDIQQQKAKKFAMCMEKHKSAQQQPEQEQKSQEPTKQGQLADDAKQQPADADDSDDSDSDQESSQKKNNSENQPE